MKNPEILKVYVSRDEEDSQTAFDVPFSGPMLVLDLLHWIQENRDAKLAFRYSCRTARCGTCAVVVNGQPVLACQ